MSLDRRRYVIDDEIGIQLALNCSDCGGRPVVYGITYPLPPHIPPGQYCYQCLLERCIKAQAVPFPMPVNLYDKLRHDIKAFYTGLRKYH